MTGKEKNSNRLGKGRGPLSLAILVAVYLVCILRYHPGKPAATIIATVSHFLTFAPFLAGGTIIVVRVFRGIAGVNPPAVVVVRIFLTLGLVAELFAGIYHYLKYGGG